MVTNPNRSAVDMKFIVHIWDAVTRWCQEQFDARKGVKFLGLGEFTMRHDIIGNMDFWNPMFVLSEGFARAHGLHDRRPKTQADWCAWTSWPRRTQSCAEGQTPC